MSRIPRRRSPWLALAAALAACDAGGAAPAQAVVLITCDTLRADRLGCYGHAAATSPNLDALARESLLFETAWSTAPITGPALSALMTGHPPEELGLESNQTQLASEATTLAERLGEAGVETAAVVSNWALRRRPELPGAGVQQGFAHFDDHMDVPEPSRPNLYERLAPQTTDAALAWLDARGGDGPYFLWVHYQDPHGPSTPPADCLVPSASTSEPELTPGPDQSGRGALPKYQVVDAERRPAVYRARYEAEIRFFDRELGRLLDGLRTRGVLERALLVFTADHGEALGEHGFYFSHGQNLHRELVQVPLLVRPPGGAPAAARVRGPASHLDLYPTLLAALGLDPGATRGVDLLTDALPPERVLPQYLRKGWGATGASHRLVVEHGRRQLFDLVADPGEKNDLAETHPDLVKALAEGHREFARKGRLAPLSPERPTLSPEDKSGLDALGYGGDDGD